jgi:hypothetical protein
MSAQHRCFVVCSPNALRSDFRLVYWGAHRKHLLSCAAHWQGTSLYRAHREHFLLFAVHWPGTCLYGAHSQHLFLCAAYTTDNVANLTEVRSCLHESVVRKIVERLERVRMYVTMRSRYWTLYCVQCTDKTRRQYSGKSCAVVGARSPCCARCPNCGACVFQTPHGSASGQCRDSRQSAFRLCVTPCRRPA